MNDREELREVFRRSGLTTMPEWIVAGSVSLAVGLAAQHFGLSAGWEGTALMGLPLVWAGGRTLQWASQTWTVTADRRLVIRQGLLFPTRCLIHLCSVGQVTADAPLATRGLNIGHIAFEATDSEGQRRHFRWTWMKRHDRLCEIIEARGELPIGRRTWLQVARETAKQRLRTSLRRLARALRRADLQDYGRFMAFCHHVFRAEQGGQWPPATIPAAEVDRWLAVLQQARVVVSAPNDRGWRVAGGIDGLADIRRRLGPDELQRAIKQSNRFQLRWRWAM